MGTEFNGYEIVLKTEEYPQGRGAAETSAAEKITILVRLGISRMIAEAMVDSGVY